MHTLNSDLQTRLSSLFAFSAWGAGVLLLLLAVPLAAFAQAPTGKAPRTMSGKKSAPTKPAENQPLSVIEILGLWNADESPQYLAELIRRRGVDFRVSEDFVKGVDTAWEQLHQAGDEKALHDALLSARLIARVPSRNAAETNPALVNRVANGNSYGWDFSRAERNYRAAVDLDPRNPVLLLDLGYVLMRERKYDEAETQFRAAIRLWPNFPVGHSNLGQALLGKGSLEAAMAEQRTAIRLDPDYADGHGNLGVALALKGDSEGGKAELREALRIDPERYGWRVAYARVLAAENHTDDAIGELREIIRLRPDFAEAHTALGMVLLSKKDWDQVITEEKTAQGLNLNAPAPFAIEGMAQLSKGNWDEAMRASRYAVRISPNWAYPHYILGLALEKKRDLQSALDEVSKAHQFDPKDPTIQADYQRMQRELAKEQKPAPAELYGPSQPAQRTQAAPEQAWRVQGPIGAKFGTRDPMTCSSTKEPVNGPISAEQAMLYFMCWREGDHDGLVLIENLKLTVGKGHMPSLSESDTDMDRDSPIYPIRGSFTLYNCYTFRSAPGRNCTATDEPAATGTCYKTSFGDWHCNMEDSYSIIDDSRRHPNMPPPPVN